MMNDLMVRHVRSYSSLAHAYESFMNLYFISCTIFIDPLYDKRRNEIKRHSRQVLTSQTILFMCSIWSGNDDFCEK